MIRVVPALVRVDRAPRQSMMALMIAPPGHAAGYYEIGVTSRAAPATGRAFAAAWCGPRPVAALAPATESGRAALCADVTMRGARR